MTYLDNYSNTFTQDWLKDKTQPINYENEEYPFAIKDKSFKSVKEYIDIIEDRSYLPHNYYKALVAKSQSHIEFARYLALFDLNEVPSGIQQMTIEQAQEFAKQLLFSTTAPICKSLKL